MRRPDPSRSTWRPSASKQPTAPPCFHAHSDRRSLAGCIWESDLPIARDDSAYCTKNENTEIPVLQNDTDIEDDPIYIFSYSQPSNGTVTQDTPEVLTYTPNPDFLGDDVFTYTVDDGNGGQASATVTVKVVTAAVLKDLLDGDEGSELERLFSRGGCGASPIFLHSATGLWGLLSCWGLTLLGLLYLKRMYQRQGSDL